jgi:hypothetical protein
VLEGRDVVADDCSPFCMEKSLSHHDSAKSTAHPSTFHKPFFLLHLCGCGSRMELVFSSKGFPSSRCGETKRGARNGVETELGLDTCLLAQNGFPRCSGSNNHLQAGVRSGLSWGGCRRQKTTVLALQGVFANSRNSKMTACFMALRNFGASRR